MPFESKGTQFENTVSQEVPEDSAFGGESTFEKDILKDVAGAQASFKRAADERGLKNAPQQGRQVAESYRIAGKTLDDDLVKRKIAARDILIKDLVVSSGLTEGPQVREFENQMKKRLMAFESKLTRARLRTGQMLDERQANAVQRRQMQKMFGQLTGMGIGALTGGAAGAQAGGNIGGTIS